MAKTKKWIVTTTGKRGIQEITQELKKLGFNVDQVHNEIGTFTGRAGEDIVERVRSVPGVSDISPDESVDIGPPDAPVTW
jgi:excinuclease UvrABC helicase subunit UvrB